MGFIGSMHHTSHTTSPSDRHVRVAQHETQPNNQSPSCAELPDLCEGFWQQDSPCARVLHYALDDARDALFPAAPAPLLRMLTALTADSGTALFAAQYLRSLRGVAAVHEAGEGAVAPNGSEDTVVAAKAFALPGLPLVTVPQVGVMLSWHCQG